MDFRKPVRHRVLGIPGYVQFTSPIRRYVDRLTHYQVCCMQGSRIPNFGVYHNSYTELIVLVYLTSIILCEIFLLEVPVYSLQVCSYAFHVPKYMIGSEYYHEQSHSLSPPLFLSLCTSFISPDVQVTS